MSKKKSAPASTETPSVANSNSSARDAAKQDHQGGRLLTVTAIEQHVVDEAIDENCYLMCDDFGRSTLTDMRDYVLDNVNARIRHILVAEEGRAGTRLTLIDNMTPDSAARIALAKLPIASIYPPDKIDDASAVGLVCIYADKGPYEGTYHEVAASDYSAWAHQLALTPSLRWRKDFEAFLREMALSPEHRLAYNDDQDLIWMNDCIFDYRTKEHIPFSPELVSLTKSAASAPWDGIEPPEDVWTLPNGDELRESEFFAQLSDPETVETIYQVIGAGLRGRVSWDVIPILYNERGSNGKSTVLNAMQALVGPQSWAASDLETLAGCGSHGQFGIDGLETKSLIVCPDSEASAYIAKSNQLKQIITHDPVDIHGKYKQRRTVVFHALIVALANSLPRLRDKTEAMRSRFLVVPFTACFARHTDAEDTGVRDVFVKRQAFIDWLAWKVLVDLPDYYDIHQSAAGANASTEWNIENDSVADFFATEIETIPSKVKPDSNGLYCDCVLTAKAYEIYKFWLCATRPEAPTPSQRDFVSSLVRCAEASPNWDVQREANGRIKRFDAAKYCNKAERPTGKSLTGDVTYALLLWDDVYESRSRTWAYVPADEQGFGPGIIRAYPDGEPPEKPEAAA